MGLQKNNGQIVQRKKPSQGFAIITLILTLPLILAVVFGVLLLFSTIQWREQLQSVCFKKVWQYQSKSEVLLNQMLALNPRSIYLTAQMTNAQIRLAAATGIGDVGEIAHQTAQIARISMQQLKLQKVQNGIKTADQINWSQFMFPHLPSLPKNFKVKTIPSGQTLQIEPQHIPNMWAPSYQTKSNFTRVQTARLDLTLKNPHENSFLNYIGRLWRQPRSAFDIKISCAASLEKRGVKWVTVLQKARP